MDGGETDGLGVDLGMDGGMSWKGVWIISGST